MALYKLAYQGTIQRSDGAVIPPDERNRAYRDYLDWLAKGNTPDPADPPAPPSPEWGKFLQSLRQTTVFTLLRAQSRVDIEANALATELRTELGEAALGISTSGNIQPLLDVLAVGLTTSQKQEISDLIDIHYIPLTISVGIAST